MQEVFVERKAVENSSQVASVGYDPAARVLEVEYKAGGIYQYEGVPPDMADALVRSDSVGGFLHRHIKDRFEHRKVA